MGDGVLVYFGYPHAHEDDAERAVRAGLELVAAVTALKSPVSLQTRIGIATGLVIVGDLIGSGAAQEQTVVGETPNLAARLQGIAEPNTVVIAEGTRRLLGNLFELEVLGAKDLKGIAGPLRAWVRCGPVRLKAALRRYTQSPVLMILEDAHWTDPTSLEAFGRVVECIRRLPVLLIVTFRPDFDVPWIGRPHVTFITINRLGERDIDAMIDGVVGNKSLPANIRHDIIERTDGIPLFVEEMTKAVLEAGSEDEAQRTAATVPSKALAVPASLHASLMARLDRLGPAKEVAQIGAVVGREFSHALLSAMARKQEADLGSALDRLVRAGLLFRQGAPPHETYLFKHALVQEAAYGTLLRELRRALHARIAETLEGRFADIAETQPELLARHCTEAGLIEKAAGLWHEAGQRSVARAALLEGTEQLKRAVDQITTLPPTPALRGKEIKTRYAFANALTLTGDFVDCKEQYDRALAIYDLAEHGPLTTRSGLDIGVALLSSRSLCLWGLGYPAASRSDAAHALKNARETGQTTTLMYALFYSGYDHFYCRNYPAANAQLDELIALADERGALIWKALGTAVLGSLFAVTGKASDAVRAITSAIISLRSTGTVLYEPFNLWHLAIAYADLGQLDDAGRCIDDAIEKAERSQEKWCEAEVHRIAGEIAIRSPQPDAAKAETYFERALAVARARRAKSWELRAAMSMARLWRDQGKRDEARDLLAPVYGWFTEGFDTLDLKEAKALLNELRT